MPKNQRLYDPNQKNIKIIPKKEQVDADNVDMTDARQIYKSIMELEKVLAAPVLNSDQRITISKLYIQLINIDPKFIQKYDLNNRMWKNGVYTAIKTVKHTKDFIPLIEALLEDYNTLIKLETKFTGLYYCHRGDLYRYSATFFFPESAEYYLGLAQTEYHKAVQIQPTNGLFWNQLGVISGMQKKYLASSCYFIRSLCVKQPFVNAKESLLNSLAAGKTQFPFLELAEILYSKVNADKFEKQLYKYKRAFEFPEYVVPICIGLDYILPTKYKEETLSIMKRFSKSLIQQVCEWLLQKKEHEHLQILLIYCLLEKIELEVELKFNTDTTGLELEEVISKTPMAADQNFIGFEPLQKLLDNTKCNTNDNLQDRLGLLTALLRKRGLVNGVIVESKERIFNEAGAQEFDFQEFDKEEQEQPSEREDIQYANFEPDAMKENSLSMSNLNVQDEIDDDSELNHLIKLKQQLSKSFQLTKDTLLFIDTNYMLDNMEQVQALVQSGNYTIAISTVVLGELKGLERKERTSKTAKALFQYIKSSRQSIIIQRIDGSVAHSSFTQNWDGFESADDAILYQVRQSNGSLLTRDMNMRLKARALGIHVLDSIKI
ncbi:hypothetical protein HK103_003942 [Boothiomyces macroporosus]|uniref:PIN domain-containing protein n=1 Tax=Boothiomyces macroporosus TaxID=261099 RepID=A0AAD5UPZ6_9FUNG|nr:hypothetical protein HK103_003942 [Boothiomyces macroporosus]